MFLRKLVAPKASYDPLLGSVEIQAARTALAAGDWEPANALMQRSGDRSLIVSGLASTGVLTSHYTRYAEMHPGSAAHTLLAVRLTQAAWAIRGRGYADTVSQSAWRQFATKLSEAQNVALHGAKLGPPSADAHAALMVIGRGLNAGMAEIELQFDLAHDLVPFHNDATAAMMQARCNKWHGTHEAMFSFARWVAQEAAPSAPVQWAIPLAHFERWASMQESGVSQKHYFSQPATKAEIESAARTFLGAIPAGRASRDLLLALNWFVLTLASAKKPNKALVADCVDRIDGRVTEWPWTHLWTDPATGYRSFVQRAM